MPPRAGVEAVADLGQQLAACLALFGGRDGVPVKFPLIVELV